MSGHKEPAIDSLIANLHSPDGEVRERARLSLVALGTPTVPTLVKVLADPHHQVRWEAAKALDEIRDPTAAPALVAALEDEEFDIRWLAAEGLALLGHDGWVPLLEALAQRGDSAWLQEGAHHILSDYKDLPDELEPLMAALEGPEPNIEVPQAARDILTALGE